MECFFLHEWSCYSTQACLYAGKKRSDDGCVVWTKSGRLKLKTASRTDALEAAWILVGRAGIEPTTNGLKVRCSTS